MQRICVFSARKMVKNNFVEYDIVNLTVNKKQVNRKWQLWKHMKENQVGSYRSDVDDKHSEANSIHFIEFLSHSKISSGHQKFHDTLMCFEYF